MRNLFAPRFFHTLSLGERIIHALVTLGLPIAILEYVAIDGRDEGWSIGIPFALIGGVVLGLVAALLEHAFFKLTNRASRTRL